MWSMLIMIRNEANAEMKDAKCDAKYTTQNEKAKGKDTSVTDPQDPTVIPLTLQHAPINGTQPHRRKNSDAMKRRPNDGGYQM